jgi:DNA-binding IclR family transcriptional regulator
MPDELLEATVRSSKAPAIARAAAVMRLLGRSDAPMSLQAIASELGLAPSTCLYVLRALVQEELVGLDPATKRYELGAAVLTLARNRLRRDPFPDMAQHSLDRLAERFGVTTVGVEIAGLDHIVAVAVSEGKGNFRLSTQVGSRFPALISATGRCIAAFGNYAVDRLQGRFDTLRWDNPPDFAEWLSQVQQTSERGFALDVGHYIAGVTVIAAPVWRGSGRPSHALVATGLSRAFADWGLEGVGEAVKAQADALTQRLRG